jgi:NodT family efflux transporter outer membrane factor (OMF) lipoprotein
VGVPSELLRRRPDIRQAEAQIHGATARIGVAEADLFPHFTISGALGFQSARFSTWFDSLNGFWSFGPGVSWQLFSTGRVLSNIELAKALTEESLLTYQQTVLTALQQVEDALVIATKEEERHKALADAVTSNRKALDLATQLYTQGQTDFLNVLQAQGALFTTEDALVQSTRTLSANLVSLYEALGGGWSEEAGPGQNTTGAAPALSENR